MLYEHGNFVHVLAPRNEPDRPLSTHAVQFVVGKQREADGSLDLFPDENLAESV